MKKMLIVYLSLLLFHLNASAQDAIITVNGKVTESGTGMPIPSANVIEKGTSNGVMTNFDGEFTIDVPSNAVLVISYISFATTEIPVNGQTELNIVMDSQASALDEVIVTGYSTKRRSELSSSVSVVSGEDLNDVTSNDVANLLQGKAAGVIVSSDSGNPSAGSNIIIRGSSSINAGSEPLYVVDGIIGGTANPNDIASITVLKDAAATGLYGSRAANGVIIITTKTGRSGETEVRINSTVGFSEVDLGNFEVMNSQQLYDYQRSFWDPATFDQDRPASLLQQDTDWTGLGFRTGITQSHTIAVSGGSDKTRMYISGNYFDQKGTLRHSGRETLNVRSNVAHDINENLEVEVRFNASLTERENDASGNYGALYGIYTNMPWDNPFNPDGSLKVGTEEGWTGRYTDNFLHGWQYNFDLAEENSLDADIVLNYKILEGLTFSTHNRASYISGKRELYYDIRARAGVGQGRLTNDFFKGNKLITSNRLTYQTNFDDHNITAIMVGEGESNYYDFTSVTGAGLAPGLNVMDAASVILGASSNTYENAFLKGLIQVDYDFNSRYFLVGSFIRESSSRFGANNRAANFYTMGASWMLSNEEFMADQDVFDQLKLRASYGVTGNAQIANYQTLGLYSFSTQYAGNSASFPSQLENPDLTWEKAKSINFGVDMGLWQRHSLSIDAYQKTTSDLLLNVQLPYTSGFSSVMRNVGSVRNRGVELVLNTTNLDGDFRWETDFNIAFNKNEVLKLENDDDIVSDNAYGPTRIVRVGEDLNSWYMRKWAGVDPENGEPLWEVVTTNANGERTVSTTNEFADATLQIVGTYTPDFTGGMNNELSYKNFTLSAFFNFVSGVDIWGDFVEQDDGAYIGMNVPVLPEGETRWEQPGDIADNPRPVFGGNLNSNRVSSRFLQDGSYIRLRNVRLSYNLPTTFLESIRMNNASIYVSGDNLVTWTQFHGFDPSANLTRSGGVVGEYPTSKTILFGLNLDF
jgi:TonB-linked SusC/RagA family outer membrane protein